MSCYRLILIYHVFFIHRYFYCIFILVILWAQGPSGFPISLGLVSCQAQHRNPTRASPPPRPLASSLSSAQGQHTHVHGKLTWFPFPMRAGHHGHPKPALDIPQQLTCQLLHAPVLPHPSPANTPRPIPMRVNNGFARHAVTPTRFSAPASLHQTS